MPSSRSADVDYGLIQGNFAVSSGMSPTSALKLEAATSHFNVVTVAGKNQKAQFAKDIIDGYHSAEFKNIFSAIRSMMVTCCLTI